MKIYHTANITRFYYSILFSVVIENHAIEVDNYLFIHVYNAELVVYTQNAFFDIRIAFNVVYVYTYILFEAFEIQQYRI